MEKIKKLLGAEPTDNLIMRLLSSVCLSALVLMIAAGGFTDISNYGKIGLIDVIICYAVCFLLFSVGAFYLRKKKESADRILLAASFGLFALLTVWSAQSYYYTFGIVALVAVLVYYFTQKEYIVLPQLTKKTAIIITAVITALFLILALTYSISKYLGYRTFNYDFGIFCQMYYNMRKCFQPLTTCERDALLSHFSVHMSLIYYIALPFYAIFPSPITLQVIQAVVVASASVPVYFLCRKHGLDDLKTVLIEAAVMFHPALFGGGSYDFHENCFLVPLLLWMFYFFEKEKYLPMLIMAALVCTVKEDAPIYVIFFAIWMICAKKKTVHGILLALFAAFYFGAVLMWMSKYGDGIMAGRYGNFLANPNDGLFSAVKNILANPGYVFTQLFVDKEGEYSQKMLYILQMMLPFAFLPLCVKKITNLILLFPMILINLMSLYVYQASISFQYVYGPLVFIVYLVIVNIGERDEAERKKINPALIVSVCAAVLLLFTEFVPKTIAENSLYNANKADIEIINNYLDTIPDDAKVCATTYLIPQLSKRDVLYEDSYHKIEDGEVLDYVIFYLKYDREKFIDSFMDAGYVEKETVMNAKGDNGLLLVLVPGEKLIKSAK